MGCCDHKPRTASDTSRALKLGRRDRPRASLAAQEGSLPAVALTWGVGLLGWEPMHPCCGSPPVCGICTAPPADGDGRKVTSPPCDTRTLPRRGCVERRHTLNHALGPLRGWKDTHRRRQGLGLGPPVGPRAQHPPLQYRERRTCRAAPPGPPETPTERSRKGLCSRRSKTKVVACPVFLYPTQPTGPVIMSSQADFPMKSCYSFYVLMHLPIHL